MRLLSPESLSKSASDRERGQSERVRAMAAAEKEMALRISAMREKVLSEEEKTKAIISSLGAEVLAQKGRNDSLRAEAEELWKKRLEALVPVRAEAEAARRLLDEAERSRHDAGLMASEAGDRMRIAEARIAEADRRTESARKAEAEAASELADAERVRSEAEHLKKNAEEEFEAKRRESESLMRAATERADSAAVAERANDSVRESLAEERRRLAGDRRAIADGYASLEAAKKDLCKQSGTKTV